MSPVRGWGERELPDGYKWTEDETGRLLSGKRGTPSFASLDQEQLEGVLRVFAPDEIEEEPQECVVEFCELIEGHREEGWAHLCEYLDGTAGLIISTRGESHALGWALSEVARKEAPWFDELIPAEIIEGDD